MMDWIFDELQYKSRIHDVSGEVTVFDIGVVKSDVVVSKDIQEQLKEAVKPFEDIPEDQRDYHPDSDDQVVDLVHPSLFPVVYGRTRVLPEKILSLDDCLHYVGQGEVLAIPPKKDRDHSLLQGIGYGNSTASSYPFYSKDFQWLPCEVELPKGGGCQIKSYINNAHPVHHKALYQVVEKIIDRTIPLWETSLSEPCEHRIHFDQVEYADHPEPEPVEPEDEEEWNDYHDLLEEWLARQPIILPEPGDFRDRRSPSALELRKHFPDTNMQIIVKLANIELTPGKPTYNGGSWHIEGQLVRNSLLISYRSFFLGY